METKDLSPSTASLIAARLKPKPARPEHRVPIEPARPSDSRRSRRQSACIQAAILSERLDEPVACVIRNLSASGARIEIVKVERKPFVTEERIPDRFTLGFRLERTEVDCEVVWQRGNNLGIRFLSLPRHV
ncbi:MAG: PilZ domain-containing protein [Hyphomicrobiaceae bacterium]|nr:PilZ domain-containing protein [Hyphomicrobiaceae bacterium]